METHVECGQFVELDLITSSNNKYYQPKRQKHYHYHHYLQTIQEEQMQEQVQTNEILAVSLPFSKKNENLYVKKSLFIYSSFTISLLCLIIIFYL